MRAQREIRPLKHVELGPFVQQADRGRHSYQPRLTLHTAPHRAASIPSIDSIASNTPIMLVYIDGSAIRNGRPDAQAGWGVYFPNPGLNDLSSYGRLPGDLQTNNRAELYAMLKALQLFRGDGRPLTIRCDSRYVKDCMDNWRWKWKRNGWLTVRGTSVLNRDLIEDIEAEFGRLSDRA
ncbi:hypothetical protein PHSY_002524 [Pseudozyma hubeiensis SY62]|uniref:ribonuclease H n=1 Tax=Pseudozyma hubeiensis (strain SY62) TaxID=1305764 RepID=R9P161_PSEHS|nr:hypothetical protein PHSY_002524 [Pseudozyma hubeiensis SY62]GAC94951.1 hypothetical protein PHSY_002524 [Pseudozyma hubeiensis SY62]